MAFMLLLCPSETRKLIICYQGYSLEIADLKMEITKSTMVSYFLIKCESQLKTFSTKFQELTKKANFSALSKENKRDLAHSWQLSQAEDL